MAFPNAATTLLSLGVNTIAQNVVNALPQRRLLLTAHTATPLLEQANDTSFSDKKSVTLDSNNQAEVGSLFLRSTNGAGAVVSLKALA